MKPLIVHAEAEDEIRAATEAYDRQRAGLGREFRLELEHIFDQIRRLSQVPAPLDEHGTRKQRCRRFPFTVYYLELDQAIWILAVAHQKRRPGYWSHRTPTKIDG